MVMKKVLIGAGLAGLVFFFWGLSSLVPTLKGWLASAESDPYPLASLEEGHAYERGDRVRFTGVSVPERLGEHRWRQGSYSGNQSLPHGYWVMPVVEVGEGTPTEVQMWLCSPQAWSRQFRERGPWLDRVREGFDGKEVTAKVLSSAGEPSEWAEGAAWQKAIAEVTKRTGMTSHPRALVVSWPPEDP
jgi:hypothetical protein